MNDDWIQKQVDKYAGSNFGEPNNVVERDMEVWRLVNTVAKMTGKRFLDLGCNNGRICHEMQAIGKEVLGVDLPEIIAKVEYDVPLRAMNLEEEFPEGEWDLIFCRETIEHLRNYKEVLKKIIGALSTKGRLILTGPYDDRERPDRGCPEHVRIFKDQELDRVVEECGGKILESHKEKKPARSRILLVKQV